MKKTFNIIACTIAAFSLASCAVTRPYDVTNNPIGSKEGKSETICLFAVPMPNTISSGICLNDKYSLKDAVTSGKISNIATIDVKQTDFILFSKYELIVTGN